MKKLFTLGVLALGALSLSACSDTDVVNNDEDSSNLEDQIIETEFEAGASIEETETLAILSYLTGGFLDFESSVTVLSYDFLADGEEDTELEIESELDEVNVYLEQLKVFMDDGTNPMSSMTVTESDLEEYDTLISYTMYEDVYQIYFKMDPETLEFVGLLIFNDIEFDLTGFSSLEYHERLQEGDEDLEDANNVNPSNIEDGEIAEKMVLRATSGDDYIEMVYLVDSEDDEVKTVFNMKKSIDGVESSSSIKIFEDEDGLQVKVDDGENYYNFKKEVSEDGIVYQLNYRVDGVIGLVRITETVDEFGEVSYEYFINEAGSSKTIEKAAPRHSTDNETNGNNA